MNLINPRNCNTVLTLSLILVPIYVFGCEKSSPPVEDEFIRRRSVRFCRKVIADPKSSKHAKSLAEEILRKRDNDIIDPEPVLVDAGLTQPEGRHVTILVVGISDEDGDLAGIGIRELHAKPDGYSLSIEEEYPVFGYASTKAASYYIFKATIRKGNERKNEKDWKEYLDAGLWDRDHMPYLWISVPEPGKIDIEIWVYDHAGHKSELVTLDNWIPSVKKQ